VKPTDHTSDFVLISLAPSDKALNKYYFDKHPIRRDINIIQGVAIDCSYSGSYPLNVIGLSVAQGIQDLFLSPIKGRA
jgi:hypothetical protein